MSLADHSLYSRNRLGEGIPCRELLDRERAYTAGSNELLKAIRGGKAQSQDIIWNDGFSGTTFRKGEEETVWHRIQQRQFEQRVAADEAIERLRVSRDPCPKCGVRGDVGCKHRNHRGW